MWIYLVMRADCVSPGDFIFLKRDDYLPEDNFYRIKTIDQISFVTGELGVGIKVVGDGRYYTYTGSSLVDVKRFSLKRLLNQL